MRSNCLKICLQSLIVIILASACRHEQTMNKSHAEKALRIFDSELLGTAVGISQTDGWTVFLGLLRSDSIPFPGDRKISDSLPIALPIANSFFQSVFQKFPLNFNQDYFKNGKKVCSINSYFKTNTDSAFYIRKLIFIRPCNLEMKCLYIRGQWHHSGRIYLVISVWDTTGT
ncbi:MAG: hypothetical protein NTW31_00040, partial [Bacteroidetes bacterium]|nr:hypothetical protein [Bacteroidota bacterium]